MEPRNGGEGVPHDRAEIFLTALLPPSSVSREFEEIQDEIFASTGNYSALALPPLVPLIFSRSCPDCESILALASMAAGAFSLDARILCEDSVFFRLNEEERLGRLAGSFPEIGREEGFMPIFPGIFLGQGEPGRPAERIAGCPIRQGGLSWKAAEIVALNIVHDRRRWWSALSWETALQAYCPRAGKASHHPR